MKRMNNNSAIESLLVMMLMVVFAAATAFIIIQGKLAFERVTENKAEDEQARIALAYVNKQIRQNDREDNIVLLQGAVEGHEALRIGYDEPGLYTYIFYDQGTLYECYTDMEPSLDLSTPIAQIGSMDFEITDGMITMSIEYEYHGEIMILDQVMALRSGGD